MSGWAGSRDDCMSESLRITIYILSIIVSVLCYTFCFAFAVAFVYFQLSIL